MGRKRRLKSIITDDNGELLYQATLLVGAVENDHGEVWGRMEIYYLKPMTTELLESCRKNCTEETLEKKRPNLTDADVPEDLVRFKFPDGSSIYVPQFHITSQAGRTQNHEKIWDVELVKVVNRHQSKAGNLGTLLIFDLEFTEGELKGKPITAWRTEPNYRPFTKKGWKYNSNQNEFIEPFPTRKEQDEELGRYKRMYSRKYFPWIIKPE